MKAIPYEKFKDALNAIKTIDTKLNRVVSDNFHLQN